MIKLIETMFPKDFDRHTPGSCMAAAELATKYLLSKGIKNFQIVEGWVSPEPEDEGGNWELYFNPKTKKWEEYGSVFSHTWIEFKNGKTFDPTQKQWKELGFSPDEMKIVKVKTKYTPEEYLETCEWEPSDWKKFQKTL